MALTIPEQNSSNWHIENIEDWEIQSDDTYRLEVSGESLPLPIEIPSIIEQSPTPAKAAPALPLIPGQESSSLCVPPIPKPSKKIPTQAETAVHEALRLEFRSQGFDVSVPKDKSSPSLRANLKVPATLPTAPSYFNNKFYTHFVTYLGPRNLDIRFVEAWKVFSVRKGWDVSPKEAMRLFADLAFDIHRKREERGFSRDFYAGGMLRAVVVWMGLDVPPLFRMMEVVGENLVSDWGEAHRKLEEFGLVRDEEEN